MLELTNPTAFGVPLQYVSLVTLTVQNSALTILLHHSRTVVAPSQMYSAASAVLLNEILKGCISFTIAYYNAVSGSSTASRRTFSAGGASVASRLDERRRPDEPWELARFSDAAAKLRAEIFSSDCWKLSIPACLYVIQNNLQFVAAANLDVPTFQVTYNLKILTTALFSVLLLNRRLTPKKWFALLLLAAGVGIVQLQSSSEAGGGAGIGLGDDLDMDPAKGLLAVACACMTSGLAGVYFEMVLKGSRTDLWIRNVQLSFFSLLPAIVPVFFPNFSLFFSSSSIDAPSLPREAIFAHFGFWAWAVVLTQVLGGLVTALVIKYSDNIMKGFATSLAIVISFLAGVAIFHFRVTSAFMIGSLVVVTATYLYNSPDRKIKLSSRLPISNPTTPGVVEKSAIDYDSLFTNDHHLAARHPSSRSSTEAADNNSDHSQSMRSSWRSKGGVTTSVPPPNVMGSYSAHGKSDTHVHVGGS